MKATTACLGIVSVLTVGLIMAAQPVTRARPAQPQVERTAPATPVRSTRGAQPTTYPADDDLSFAADQRTRVQVEVFELTCPVEAVEKIDPTKLAVGSYSETMDRFKELGEGRLMHRIDLPLLLSRTAEASIKFGTNTPVVRTLTMTAGGTVTPSVDYKDTGCVFELKGAWLADGGAADVLMTLEWSGLGLSGIEVGGGVKLPIFEQFKFRQPLRVQSGKPIAFLVNQAGSPADPEPKAHVGIVRMTLTHETD